MFDEMIKQIIAEQVVDLQKEIKKLQNELQYYRGQYKGFLNIQKTYMDFIRGLQAIIEENSLKSNFSVQVLCEQDENIAKTYRKLISETFMKGEETNDMATRENQSNTDNETAAS